MIARLLSHCGWVVEGRSAEEVRADVDAEFEHHVERLREDLARSGVDGEELERRVAERFGDRRRLARECIGIALKERIMLQRVNLVLLIVVGLAVAWTAWGTAQAGARNAEAIEALSRKLEAMTIARTPAGAAADSKSGVISIRGPRTVGRPGTYAVEAGQRLTLRRALVAASFSVDHWTDARPITVVRLVGEDRNEVVFTLSKEEFTKPEGKDFALQAGDMVEAP